MGSMMLLSAQDAAKFWPIYDNYDTQLTKLNDQRVENIKEYAQNYDDMTDAKADELNPEIDRLPKGTSGVAGPNL